MYIYTSFLGAVIFRRVGGHHSVARATFASVIAVSSGPPNLSITPTYIHSPFNLSKDTAITHANVYGYHTRKCTLSISL